MGTDDLQHESGARILKFTKAWEGRFEPAAYTIKVQQSALHDARQIVAAKRASNDWTSDLLLGVLSVLNPNQLSRLELILTARAGAPDATDGAHQALALAHLINSAKDYRERVRVAIEALQERGA